MKTLKGILKRRSGKIHMGREKLRNIHHFGTLGIQKKMMQVVDQTLIRQRRKRLHLSPGLMKVIGDMRMMRTCLISLLERALISYTDLTSR